MGLSNWFTLVALPGGTEWVVIIAVVVGGLFFGAKKIPQMARSFGKVEGEYRKAKAEATKELDMLKLNHQGHREKLEEIAEKLGITYSDKNDVELKAAIDLELQKTRSS